MARPVTSPHGTKAAINRHNRAHESLCDACKVEQRRLNAINYRKRKERTT